MEMRYLSNESPTATGRRVSGYALKFGRMSRNLGGAKNPWFEIVEPGSLPDLTTQDVRCYFNHDKNFLLARSKFGKGSLELTVDSVGLKYEFQAPNSTVGNDLLEAVKRGDIDQSSFSFSVAEGGDKWVERGGKRVRLITKIAALHDVSPVVEPAYQDTSVSARKNPSAPGRPDTSCMPPADQHLVARLGIL